MDGTFRTWLENSNPQQIADSYYQRLRSSPGGQSVTEAIWKFCAYARNVYETDRAAFNDPLNFKVMVLIGRKLGLQFYLFSQPITAGEAYRQVKALGDQGGLTQIIQLADRYPDNPQQYGEIRISDSQTLIKQVWPTIVSVATREVEMGGEWAKA